MSGNLDISETASSLVRRALDSGEWELVRDASGRECYFNPATRETTRDLRVLLLQRFDWAKEGGLAAALDSQKKGQGDQKAGQAAADGDTAAANEEAKKQLAAAKRTIDMYEREVTELRLRLFGVVKAGAPSIAAETRGFRPDVFDVQDTAASTSSPQEPASVEEGLRQQLAAARRINALLLDRVVTDRQQKHLCAACLERLTVSAAPVDHASLLASESITYPSSLAPFARLPDRAMVRTMPEDSGDSVPYRATAPAPSIGYLPATFRPAEPTMNSLRPWDTSTATSHAPLRMATDLPTRLPQPGPTWDSPRHGASAATQQPPRDRDRGLVGSPAPGPGSYSSRPGGSRQRRLAPGVPPSLYDGGVLLRRSEVLGQSFATPRR